VLTIRPGAVRSVGSVKKRVLAVLTVSYVAAVLAATLTPAGFPTRVFNALGALIGAAVGEVLLRSGSAGTRRYRAGSAASAPTSP